MRSRIPFTLFAIVLIFAVVRTVLSQTPESTPLTVEKPVERELKGDGSHSFSLDLKAGQFLDLVVEQKGIDAVVMLFDPSGKKVVEVDSPNGTMGPEPVGHIAEASGSYRLEVRSLEVSAPAGRYQIRVNNIRTSIPTDTGLLKARKLYAEAHMLRLQPSAETLRAAISKYLEAIPLFRAAADSVGENESLNNLGYAYGMLGENQNALEYFRLAAAAAHKSNRPAEEAISYANVATVLSRLGQHQKAIETFGQVLEIARTSNIDARGILAYTHNNMGAIYQELNEMSKALESFDQAYVVFTAVGDVRMSGIALGNAGVVHLKIGEYDKALEKSLKALEFERSVNDSGEIGRLLGNIGSVYHAKKDYEKALDYMNQAILLARASGNRYFEAAALGNLGSIQDARRDYGKALEASSQALSLHTAMGDRSGEARVLHNLFSQFASEKKYRMAVFLGKRSVNTYQELRSSVQGLDKNTQKSFLRSFEDVYRRVGRVLADEKRFAEAQRLLNLFKDQQYFDLRSAGPIATLPMTKREEDLSNRLSATLAKIVGTIQAVDRFRNTLGGQQADPAKMVAFNELSNKQAAAQRELLEFMTEAERQFAQPPDDKDREPAIADLKTMQEWLREISKSGGSAVAVYTLVGTDDYRAIVVTQDNAFVANPADGKSADARSKELSQLLRTPKYDPRTVSKALYDVVFAPIEKKLPPGTRTILWSLDGSLRYVPVSALYDGRQYLAERYENVVFTRSDKERMTRAVSSLQVGTGLGSSEAHTVELAGSTFNASALPSVKTELDNIFLGRDSTGVLAGSVLVDSAFTKAAMIREMKISRPLVHIASHFKFEPGDEARSFLLMGDGTPYTLDEMKKETDLFKGVDLLTLSACETAAQKPDANGREVDGFAELAQRLGAGAVMASLWEVSDDSTAELMARFYRNYRGRSGVNKATALRRAQLALLSGQYSKPLSEASRQLERERSEAATPADASKLKLYRPNRSAPYSHPYYWSPFVLIGNWK